MRREAAAVVAVAVGAVGTAFLLPYMIMPFLALATPITTADFVCFEAAPLVIDFEVATPGGKADTFEVPGGCRLEFDLDVRSLAGDLRLWVSGPGGAVYEARVVGADTGFSEGPTYTRTESVAPGEVPGGTYTYRYVVNGAAEFSFIVSAYRAV